MNKQVKWEAVFFDFDGVILDSVDVKTDAFAAMFREYGPDVEAEVVAYHLANGGISRYEKFRYYHEKLLHRKVTEEELAALGEKFSDMVLQGVLASPYVGGAREILDDVVNENIPAYIVTGTPQEEIEYIVDQKKLGPYFREVHGSPRKKTEIVKELLEKNSFRNENCLFIGDAMSDCMAAQDTGVVFLGIVKTGEKNTFPEGTTVSTVVTLKL